jgi:predicted nucleic acid-binding protein
LLIDLWREARRPAAAAHFLKEHADWQIGLPWVTKGEFLSGAVWAGHKPEAFASLLNRYPVIHSSEEIVQRYAELLSALKKRNTLPGLSDVWIAATALTLKCGVITRNIKHFGSIDGLKIWSYAA